MESSTELRALDRASLPGLRLVRRGKVRDVFELGDQLLLFVATDRISAYDHVLKPAIPDKGKILNALSNHWFRKTSHLVRNHLVETDFAHFPESLQRYAGELAGRAVIARRAEVIPFECVARGYLAGSAWREYRERGTVCGEPLPAGLERSARLPEPLFTPATKALSGHDENISRAELAARVGKNVAAHLEALTLEIYRFAAAAAREAGLLLADTKLEFGWVDGELVLVDELLTPDSSRYWEASSWRPGCDPVSFDKQYVRDFLDRSGWDHQSPPPVLPAEVVEETRRLYFEAFRRLAGERNLPQ